MTPDTEELLKQFKEADDHTKAALAAGAAEMLRLGTMMTELQAALSQNHQQQALILKANQEIVDIYLGIKATVKIFGVVERICIFIMKVAAAGALIWAAWKFVIKNSLH